MFVYGLNYDLQGLVAAVTIGYSVAASVYMYLFVRTNWSKRVTKVRKTMKDAESISSEIDGQSRGQN